MRVLLVNDTIYARAVPGGSHSYGPKLAPYKRVWSIFYLYGLDLTLGQAKRYAGKWISIPKGDKNYSQLADDMTLGSIAPSNPHFGPLKARRRTSHGTRFIDVWEEAGIPGFPYEVKARESGTPLPIALSYIDNFSVGYSKWNEPVHVQPPAKAAPIASVRRS